MLGQDSDSVECLHSSLFVHVLLLSHHVICNKNKHIYIILLSYYWYIRTRVLDYYLYYIAYWWEDMLSVVPLCERTR